MSTPKQELIGRLYRRRVTHLEDGDRFRFRGVDYILLDYSTALDFNDYVCNKCPARGCYTYTTARVCPTDSKSIYPVLLSDYIARKLES